MKKLCLLSLCVAAGLSLSAQTSLVKEAEHMFKTNSADSKAALAKIQPALTNPETADKAETWFTAAKIGIGGYDHLFATSQLSPEGLSNDQRKEAGYDMIQAYDYLFKALPLDSVPDAKGKIKAKYSKDILKTMAQNYQSLKQAGIFLYEAQDYPGAVQAWEIYAQLPKNPVVVKAGLNADPDSIAGQILSYQALAMILGNEYQQAVDKVREILGTGYKSMDLLRYGVAAAQSAKDSVATLEFAQIGYDNYGTGELSFIGQLINHNLQQNNFEAASTLVNAAINAQPQPEATTLAQLYDILGTILERQENTDGAFANYKKSTEINPDFARGYYDMARMIYNKAIALDEEADEATRQSTINPQFLEAAALFEKAYDMDNDGMSDVPGILYRLFYRLEGEEGTNTKLWEDRR